jgi:PIN domain nuclease of toxin-antitoxin system
LNFLLDTHLLLWAAGDPDRMSSRARGLIEDAENVLYFSVASLWEISIKRGLGRPDFLVEPRILRRALLDNGYVELVITADHALAVEALPDLHKDPFDRLLVAQARTEGITLLTADSQVAQYGEATALA